MEKVRSPGADSDKAETARRLRAEWDMKWGSPIPARWADRPIPAEVIEAVDSGWLPATGRMIELGCGEAEIAAWFAERGYQAAGVDIAQAAIARAAAKHAHLPAAIDYFAIDLCTDTVPNRTFDILVDRGCLHQIPTNLAADYVRNISSMAAPGAKMLLFAKAFRQGQRFGDPAVARRLTDLVRRGFDGQFELERSSPTYLNPDRPADPLPGMAFWLSRPS